MQLNNYIQDINLIGNIISSLSSVAADSQPSSKTHSKVSGLSILKENTASQEIIKSYSRHLDKSVVDNLTLTQLISKMSAEDIRCVITESLYEQFKSTQQMIDGLKDLAELSVRKNNMPNNDISRLANSISEYRASLSDFMMILDQVFCERKVTESLTDTIEEDTFANFNFH